MVRPATPDDLFRLVSMGRQFHDASGMPFNYDPEATAGFLSMLMSRGVVLVSDTGMIGGMLLPAYTNPAWQMAVELFWWAEGGGMALLRAFEEWAANEGAQEVRMTSLASLERAGGILKAKGYAPAEISYRKVI